MATKIYENQTALEIRLNLGEDLTDQINRALIKFRKPNGFEGYWPAEVIDYEQGIIAYTFPTSSLGLDDVGFWTFWAYLYYKDGSVIPGDPIQIGVYREGKTYIAFPYGRQSSDVEETEMAQEAYEILYDNSNSGLVAANVQDAIDEIDTELDNVTTPPASGVAYDNATSGLAATDVQAAIDEEDGIVDGITALIGQAHQLVYVDSNRVDTYTEDGNINRPYKTLAAAVGVVTGPAVIRIATGTYVGNIALAGNVNLIGMGIGKTILTGTLQTGASGNCSIKEMSLQNSFTILTDTVVSNVSSIASVNASADVRAYNFDIASTAAHALAVTAGLVIVENSAISTTDNASAIVHNGGDLVLENIEADNNSASNAAVDSSGGSIRILSSTLNNAGAGFAADLDNGATSGAPNVLMNVIHVGGISTGTAYTVQEGVEGGDPTGTNFSKRPGTQIGYDNTSGLAATDVQAAIDEDLVDFGAGAPGTTPARTGAMYYNTTADTLHVWNGSAWRSITTA